MMAENATHWQSYAVRFLKGLRPLFYLEPPSESRFERLPEVPDYIERVCLTVPYVCQYKDRLVCQSIALLRTLDSVLP